MDLWFNKRLYFYKYWLQELDIIKVNVCILKKKNKVLISSRPEPKILSGFFEFPGGKVEKGEFALESIQREICEELSVKIDLSKIFFLISYQQISKKEKLLLTFFLCSKWSGRVKSLENQEIKWVKIRELEKFKMLKSNKRKIKFLYKNFKYLSSM